MIKNLINIAILLSLSLISFKISPAANVEDTQPLDKNLYYVCMHGRFDKLKDQINSGVDVNSMDELGYTALMGATSGGHKDIVKFLLDNKADANIANNIGWIALMSAVQHRNKEIIKLLIDKSDVNYQKKPYNRSILIEAIQSKCPKEVIQSLLDKGADVNLVSCGGNSPLMLASHVGNIDTVKLLLNAGADIDHINSSGESVFNWAILGQHEDVIQLLYKTREEKIKDRKDNIKKLIDESDKLLPVLLSFIADYAVGNYSDIPIQERKSIV